MATGARRAKAGNTASAQPGRKKRAPTTTAATRTTKQQQSKADAVRARKAIYNTPKPAKAGLAVLSIQQAAYLLGVSVRTVFTLLKRSERGHPGGLRSLKVGGRRKFTHADIDAFIARQRAPLSA
jgi:excisionase family DNA binding protein